MTKTVEQYDAEIESVSLDISKLSDKLGRLRGNREKAFLRDHGDRLEDIEWLINNPTNNLQHDPLRAWVKEHVGGEYNGVSVSMYNTYTGQQCFGLQLGWGADEIERNLAERTTNFKKFINLTLHLFKPNEYGFVSFGYTSGQHSGCFDLEYHVQSKSWATSNTVYRRRKDVVFHDTLDDAIQYAAKVAMTIED